MGFNLKNDIFIPIARRVQLRAESLRGLKRFPRSGFEAWLKVEIVAAIGNKVEKLQNKGVDLVLTSGDQIELKAATDLNVPHISKASLKWNVPCLFLGDASDETRFKLFKTQGVKLVAHQVFSDGHGKWILGLIKPLSVGKYKPNKTLKRDSARSRRAP